MAASLKSFALAGSILAAGLAFAPAPSRAIGALHTFQLSNTTAIPPTNSKRATPTKSFLSTAEVGSSSAPIGLIFGNAKSGLRGSRANKLTSATSQGVCLYKIGGNNNCGRITPDTGSIGTNRAGRANQISIDLFFDRDVQLVSYKYGLLSLGNRSANPTNLVWTSKADPSEEWESNSSTEKLNNKFANNVYTFANQFILKAFQTIKIAGFGGTGRPPTTQVRLDELVVREILPPPSSVPGPLPLLGAGMAYAWSRRLRSRIASAQLD
jgi:hypothetical protein